MRFPAFALAFVYLGIGSMVTSVGVCVGLIVSVGACVVMIVCVVVIGTGVVPVLQG